MSCIQGLINNFNQVEAIADMEKPHFIILSETHLTANVNELEIVLSEYSQMALLYNSTRTEGIIIYYNKS